MRIKHAKNFRFLLCGCYMYNCWGVGQIRAFVSRYDQSACSAKN